MSDDEAKWDLYLDAVIGCEFDGRTRSLRGLDAETLPAGEPIFVLTAYNPGGEDRDEALNQVAERDLERDLTAAAVTFWPALGGSRDRSWSEPGVAIAGLDRARACEIGQRYGQLAVYELNEHAVLVVRCADTAVVRTAARRK